jgi:hypothetical protein
LPSTIKLKYPQPTLEPNGMEIHFRGKLFDPSKSLDNSKTFSCTYYLHSITFVRDWQRGSRLVLSQTGFGARSVLSIEPVGRVGRVGLRVQFLAIRRVAYDIRLKVL